MELKVDYINSSYPVDPNDMSGGRPAWRQITLPIEIDPSTQTGTIRFSLEALQDIVALANSGNMSNVRIGFT